MGLLDDVMGMLAGGKGQSQLLGSLLQILGGTQQGLAPDALASQLAQVLPGFVDKLTPGGQLPDAQGLEGLLKGLLR
jgi:hypothetical protein